MALRLDLMGSSSDIKEEKLDKQESHLHLVSAHELEVRRSGMLLFEREQAQGILERHGTLWIPGVAGRSISNVTPLYPEDAYDAERGELDERERIGLYVRNSISRTVNRYLGEEEQVILEVGTPVEFLEGKNFGDAATFVLRKRPLTR